LEYVTLLALVAAAVGSDDDGARLTSVRVESWVGDALRGDDDGAARGALEMIFRQLGASLIRFARRIGASDDAEDVVTDVFSDLWVRRQTLGAQFLPEPYLYRAVRNRTLQLLRNEGRAHRREILSAESVAREQQDWSATTIDDDDAIVINAVHRAVDMLPESQRTALALRLTHGLSLTEVAESMELTVPAVKMLMQRAFKTLRSRLAPLLNEIGD